MESLYKYGKKIIIRPHALASPENEALLHFVSEESVL